LVNYMRNDQMAVSKAAMLVGVDPATAKSWAAVAGISTPRRAKILKPRVYKKVIRELKRGLSKLNVANRHGVSVETITRVLRTEVGLRSDWNDARDARARKSARAQFVEAAEAHPELGAKAIRLLAPAAYAWLYRNDRVWLTDFVDSLVPAPRGNYAAVDWLTRDAILAAEIRQAALALRINGEARRLPLWKLYQAIPELKAKLGALNRLPLTLRALQDVTRRRKAVRAGPQLLEG